MGEEKKVRDFIDPVVQCLGRETLGEVLETLDQGKPVAVNWKGWRLLLPEATAGYPLGRRVIDLPLTSVPALPADLSVTEALGRLIETGLLFGLVTEGEQPLGLVSQGRLRAYSHQTEVKDVEILSAQALKESEERYRLIFEHSLDAILLTTPDGRILAANSAACSMFGYAEAEFRAMRRENVIDPDDSRLPLALEERRRTGTFKGNLTMVRRNGSRFEAELLSAVFRDKDGFDQTSMVIHDLTEHKRSEEKLQEERNRAQKYLDVAGVMFVVLDADQIVKLVNKKGLNILGYEEEEEEEEVIGKRWVDFLPEKHRRRFNAFFGRLFSGDIGPVEYIERSVVTKSGEERIIAWRNNVIRDSMGNVVSSISSGEDITERRLAEEALKKSESRYRAIVEDQTELINRFLPDTTVTFVNEACCRYFGKAYEELVGKSFLQLIPEEDRNLIPQHLSSFSVENPVMTHEHRILKPSGEVRWMQWTNRALFSEQGSLVEFQAVGRDITERRRAEDALNESNRNFRSIIYASPLAIVILDSGGNVLQWNPSAEEIFGWKEQEVLGRPHPIVPKGREKQFQEMLGKVLSGGSFKSAEIVRQRKDGKLIELNFSSAPLLDSIGHIRGSMGIFEDITERKKAERGKEKLFAEVTSSRTRMQQLSRRLVESQETERRNVARELHDDAGQKLTGLSLNLRSIQDAEELPESVKSRIDDSQKLIQEIILSIRSVMSDLRPPVLDDYGLVAALHWYSKKIKEQAGIAISVKGRELTPRLPPEVETAFFRIAQEAVHNAVKHAKASELIVTIRSEKRKLQMVIADNGKGFDTALLEVAGLRRGWGLTNMRERANAVGGNLRVTSAPGKGTAVIAEVPRNR